jgi:hypothetical protein
VVEQVVIMLVLVAVLVDLELAQGSLCLHNLMQLQLVLAVLVQVAFLTVTIMEYQVVAQIQFFQQLQQLAVVMVQLSKTALMEVLAEVVVMQMWDLQARVILHLQAHHKETMVQKVQPILQLILTAVLVAVLGLQPLQQLAQHGLAMVAMVLHLQ